MNLNINSLLPASVVKGRVEYVKMNIIVLLSIAGTASARHMFDVQFNSHGSNGDVIERRNNGYISQNPESTPYVNSDFRQTVKAIRTKTNEHYAQSTVKYNEHSHEDSSNNISDDDYDHRLRTNAYTTEAYSTTEYIAQEVKVNTNRREQKHIADRNQLNRGVKTSQVNQQTHNVGFIKTNEQKSRSDNIPAINNNQERRPETSINIVIQNPLNERTYNITINPKKPVSVEETPLIKPTPTEESREGMDRLPKVESDEQIWVWGTEGPNVTSTEPGSLDDRAAFSGDKCPTGKAKVKGVCVETH